MLDEKMKKKLYDPDNLALIGDLVNDALSRFECQRWGVAMCIGKNWREYDSSTLLTTGSPLPSEDVLHDERGGPYFAGKNGKEPADMILSRTDDSGLCLCVWAERGNGGSPLGIGIDLAAADDFKNRRNGSEQFARLVLDKNEILLARDIFVNDYPLGYAYAFSAKEAAFKSTAPALREWYRTHNEQLIFEVREFVQTEPGRMRGTGLNGNAHKACSKLGITDIAVSYAILPGAVFTIACASKCK